ncbi:hypothetical protein HW35_10905 [Bacillus sp. X1(2014)]|jgi:hypothetical protein|nr:hypothetical protein HW35_10905 [Bacillus sp. X1(2014)]
MNLWLNPTHFFSQDKEVITNRSIILKNIIILIVGMFFVTCILYQMIPDVQNSNLFLTFAFITALSVPFYLIFNFFLSLVYLLVLIFFHPSLKISKFYTLILTYNTLNFLFSSIGVNLLFYYENNLTRIFIIGISLFINIWSLRILFAGLINFIGFSKKVSIVFCSTLFLLNLLLLIGGNFVNV